MAKRKKQSKRPQAQHKPTSRSSQRDKRKRLDTPNPQRMRTANAKVQFTVKMADLVTSMTGMLDARMAFRLSIFMAGKSMTNQCRGSMVTREYKTFLATSRLVSGVIHVPRLRQPHSFLADGKAFV